MSYPPSPGQVDAVSGDDPVDPSLLALQALGATLRRARESQRLSSADLAYRLRIGAEQLEALETADRGRLPEPVFVIAQARRVAGALQVDISAELEALRSSTSPPFAGRDPRSMPPRRPAPASAGRERRGSASGRRSSEALPSALWVAGGVLLVLAAVWGAWQLRGSLLKNAGRPTGSPTAVTPAPAPSPPSGSGGQAAGEAAPAGSVVLASREPSWVEVRRPDGTIVFRGLLRGARVFSLDKGLQVLAGRPDLVTARIGGEPARPLGAISEVRWRSLPAAR